MLDKLRKSGKYWDGERVASLQPDQMTAPIGSLSPDFPDISMLGLEEERMEAITKKVGAGGVAGRGGDGRGGVSGMGDGGWGMGWGGRGVGAWTRGVALGRGSSLDTCLLSLCGEDGCPSR